jgi:hypothetical protein
MRSMYSCLVAWDDQRQVVHPHLVEERHAGLTPSVLEPLLAGFLGFVLASRQRLARQKARSVRDN